MDKEEFTSRLLNDTHFGASISEQLIPHLKALCEVIRDEKVGQGLTEDAVLFAVLMCNDRWLADAPDHQRLLRDMRRRQVAVCGRGCW